MMLQDYTPQRPNHTSEELRGQSHQDYTQTVSSTSRPLPKGNIVTTSSLEKKGRKGEIEKCLWELKIKLIDLRIETRHCVNIFCMTLDEGHFEDFHMLKARPPKQLKTPGMCIIIESMCECMCHSVCVFTIFIDNLS